MRNVVLKDADLATMNRFSVIRYTGRSRIGDGGQAQKEMQVTTLSDERDGAPEVTYRWENVLTEEDQ